MTRLDRDLERLFAADASARVVRAVAVAPRRSAPPLLTFALAGGAVALAIVAALSLLDPSARVASPPLIPLSTPSASPTPDPCADPLRRQQVDPVVGGSKLPGAAAAGIHAVRVAGGEARWPVVFAVGPPPEGGGPLDVAPRASTRSPSSSFAPVGKRS